MRPRLVLAVVVLVAVAAGGLLLVQLAGDDEKPAAAIAPTGTDEVTPESLGDGKLRIGDLVYTVTQVRMLDPERPEDDPYLLNMPDPLPGTAYLGVFVRIENENPAEDATSAPGFLLEPTGEPGLVVMNLAAESPFALDQGGVVPAGSELPLPGTESVPAEGGGLLLYRINNPMSLNQPFQIVVNSGGKLGFIELPEVPVVPEAEEEH